MKRNRTTNHEPRINSHTSECTCGRWNGPTRRDNEQQGAYTIRANQEHIAHVAALQTSQGEMFTALTGLFVEAA